MRRIDHMLTPMKEDERKHVFHGTFPQLLYESACMFDKVMPCCTEKSKTQRVGKEVDSIAVLADGGERGGWSQLLLLTCSIMFADFSDLSAAALLLSERPGQLLAGGPGGQQSSPRLLEVAVSSSLTCRVSPWLEVPEDSSHLRGSWRLLPPPH